MSGGACTRTSPVLSQTTCGSTLAQQHSLFPPCAPCCVVADHHVSSLHISAAAAVLSCAVCSFTTPGARHAQLPILLPTVAEGDYLFLFLFLLLTILSIYSFPTDSGILVPRMGFFLPPFRSSMNNGFKLEDISI